MVFWRKSDIELPSCLIATSDSTGLAGRTLVVSVGGLILLFLKYEILPRKKLTLRNLF